jgi:hypothetical protein
MASVKQCWVKKYGEKIGLEMWEERKKLSSMSLENCVNKYGLQSGTIKYNKWKNNQKGKGTIGYYIKKYGEKNGVIKYKEKNSKLSVSVESLLKNGKSVDEIKVIREKHRKGSSITLSNMVSKYGEIEGVKRYEGYVEKNKLTSNRRLDYWLEKTDGDMFEAKKLLGEWQRRDISWFINRYGEVNGLEKYYNTNRKRGRTLENYVIKYGNTVGMSKYIESCRNWKVGQKGIFNSKGQIEVEEYLSKIYDNVSGSRNETGIILTENEKNDIIKNNTLYPDIIVNSKYIVRYNGDFWHANKTIYPNDDTVVGRVNKPAGLIREIDRQKDLIYKNRGYTVINIWDSDWQTNKDEIKSKLKNIIK